MEVWRDPDDMLCALPPPFYNSIKAYEEYEMNNHDLLIELGQDIKWLKKQHELDALWLQKSLDGINGHLAELNKHIIEHAIQIAVGASSRRRLWWTWGISITVLLVIIFGVSGIVTRLF